MKVMFAFLFISVFGFSQIDSTKVVVPLISIHFSGQIPAGDLSKRFGPNLNIGGSFMFKTKRNWIFGAESNYIFGRNVKEDVLSQLKNSDGFIIDNEGFPADLRVTERGLGIHLTGGKIFSFLAPNPNSGFMASFGAGYFHSKIKLYDAQQKIAAVKGDLAHGYDRLSSGLSLTQFVGYMYLGENRLLNLYFGIEAYEAFTQSVRKLNYDTGLPDTNKRLDMLFGLRFGWILPLYKKTPNEFYYY
ncbi:MAG: hypothetical protein Q7W45_04795 [Bacteroidota bacterium]|nr:hypothetical protein [Bacteroidota bacterium]MDP3144763.1 hypothetical protein [Bacteroidota bacterium]